MDIIGESVINLLVSALILALNVILIICAVILDVIINTFSFLLESDFVSKVYEALPVLSQADNVLTIMGVAIAIILLLAMIFHMSLAPLLSSGKNVAYPSMVIFRTMFVIPLVICAESISVYLSNLFTTFYSVMSSAFSAQIGGYTSDTSPFYLTGALTEFFSYNLSVTFSSDFLTATESSLGYLDGAMDLISSAVATILIFVLVILVGWNLIQFFLELFERFATMFFIMKVSPLCLATAIYPSTEMIAKSWLRFFVGQFSLWVLQIMCVGWVIGCLGSPTLFSDTFADTNGRMTGILAWAGISYGLINMSRHVDDYINKLGLTAATTGSDFFRDIASLGSTIHAAKNGFAAAKAGAIGLGKGFSAAGKKFSSSAPAQAYKEAYSKSINESGDKSIQSRAKAHAEGMKAFGKESANEVKDFGRKSATKVKAFARGAAETFLNTGVAECAAELMGPNAASYLADTRQKIKDRHELERMTGAHLAAQKDETIKNNLMPRAERSDETLSQRIVSQEGNRYSVESTYETAGPGDPVINEVRQMSGDLDESGNMSNLSEDFSYKLVEAEVNGTTIPAFGTDSEGRKYVEFQSDGKSMRTFAEGDFYKTVVCGKNGHPTGNPVHVMSKADIPQTQGMNEETSLARASLMAAQNLHNDGFGKRQNREPRSQKSQDK